MCLRHNQDFSFFKASVTCLGNKATKHCKGFASHYLDVTPKKAQGGVRLLRHHLGQVRKTSNTLAGL